MQSKWCMLYVVMLLHIGEQIKTKLIQSQIHYRYTCIHLLNINHFVLQTFQLLTTIFEVAFLFGRNWIVIACRGHNRHFHTCLDTSFEVDIFVKVHIGPIVDKLYHFVARANTVDTPKTLNNAHWIPMYIVINQVITILQVLTFGDTIGGYQQIYFCCNIRINRRFFF